MTLAELMPYVAAGHNILVAEFRGGKVESSGFVDTKTGQATKTLQQTYAVERQGKGMVEKVILRRFLPPETTPEKAEIKLEKGKLYAFLLDKYEMKRGTIYGRMAAAEPVIITGEGTPLGPPQGGPAGSP